MGQLSFYSAEACRPGLADLAGLLCGPAQTVSFAGKTARLSVVVAELWRARGIAGACLRRNVTVEVTTSDDEHPLVRTAFRTDLAPLAAQWTRDAVKAVPPGLVLDGAAIRLWALAAGQRLEHGYLLGVDPNAPDTHEPLGAALVRCGLPVTFVGVKGGGPGWRVTGRRRLARLAELVGPIPPGVPATDWPIG